MEKITIRNFRKVKETWDIELAPITFFTGTNNSGKSTILKSILLLNDYFKTDNLFELIFDGLSAKKHKIDCYQRAINNINWAQGKKDVVFGFENNGFEVTISFRPKSLSKDIETQLGQLISMKVDRISDGASFSLRHSDSFHYELKVDNRLSKEVNKSSISNNFDFDGYENDIKQIDERIKELKNIIKEKRFFLRVL